MDQNSPVTERTLFLGNLPQEFGEKLVVENFQNFGPIEWIDLQSSSRNFPSDDSSFYANIIFQRRESAEAAYHFANGKTINGRKLTVGLKDIRSRPSTQVFRSLPKGSTWMESRTSSSIEHHTIPMQISSPYGTYSMSAQSSLPGPPKRIRSAQIHFSYVSSRQEPITTEIIGSAFSRFGSEIDISQKKADYNPVTGVQTGYGFIHYPLTPTGISAALRAVNQVNGTIIDAIKFSCGVSHSLDEYFKTLDPVQLLKLQQLSMSEPIAPFQPPTSHADFYRPTPQASLIPPVPTDDSSQMKILFSTSSSSLPNSIPPNASRPTSMHNFL